MNGGPEGILDARLTEIALFVGGGIVTVMVLALAIWLFVRASREEREQEEFEARERSEREARERSEREARERSEREAHEKQGGGAP